VVTITTLTGGGVLVALKLSMKVKSAHSSYVSFL